MGMKLKSGADLCGFELSRFCVQNDVAIPDAPASGRKYFHTGTGMEGKYSLLGRERIFTGTAWRSAAYVDDLANLDITSNADYLALKEKVDLLSGEVDTDAIINNMKEVTAFLEGFAEDANLMSVLNNKLDKSNDAYYGLDFNSTGENGMTRMVLRNNGNVLVGIGHTGSVAYFSNYLTSADIQIGDTITVKERASNNRYTLLHSGNVGDYAITTKKWLEEDDDIPLNTTGMWTNHGGYLSAGWSASYKMVFLTDTNGIKVRTIHGSSDTDWKTIAFTDSNVASATKLATARTIWGQSFDGTGNVSGNLNLNLAKLIWHGEEGYSISCPNTATAAKLLYQAFDGHQFECAGGIAMLINSSGNVTIGSSDKAGTSAKLYVDGCLTLGGVTQLNNPQIKFFHSGDYFDLTGNFVFGANSGSWSIFNESSLYTLFRVMKNGNVGIGLTNPSAQLHVAQDIVANGTISCKGVAAEGSAPVGTVDKWAGSIATGTKSQTYTHGLGTTDITVAIYEKNGNEWVQILTDVDIVNANTIRVTFGANTTVEHRIVVMG